MTIELAPTTPQSTPATGRVAAAGKQAARDAEPEGGASFLSVLDSVDSLAATDTSPLSGVGLNPTDAPLPVQGAAISALVETDPSVPWGQPAVALLAQPAQTPQPEAGGLATVFRPVKSLVTDASPVATTASEFAGKKTAFAGALSGKSALDVSAEAALKQEQLDTGALQGSTIQQLQVKETLPDRIHKLVQELSATGTKPADATQVFAGTTRERTQEPYATSRSANQDAVVQVGSIQQGAGGAMGVDGVVAGAAAESMAGAFSEDVKYWVGQDLQKAEITLDGMGMDPVEVSISLQGNEAQVMFRTDEAQTRDALSNASAQLQEALGRQGLTLAGMSVGTSDSGGAQPQGGGDRSSKWRSGQVEVAADEPVTRGPTAKGAGRTIDLFV
ncbi:flagellar hook-length control protein FliK [Rhodoferax sp.]|uniref:flagellar hook-length control protein FliK n=1 Tax=Rhodoferax sp. TaxID=50421 RepID=UPI0025F7D1B9|nr:flagellar hook-length control protein FliK [Rhodoferax sp.]